MAIRKYLLLYRAKPSYESSMFPNGIHVTSVQTKRIRKPRHSLIEMHKTKQKLTAMLVLFRGMRMDYVCTWLPRSGGLLFTDLSMCSAPDSTKVQIRLHYLEAYVWTMYPHRNLKSDRTGPGIIYISYKSPDTLAAAMEAMYTVDHIVRL